MFLPLSYSGRNLVVRWRSTVATVLAIALVVSVFVLVLSLAAGLRESLRATGEPGNVIIMRQGSTQEITSLIAQQQLPVIRELRGIAHGPDGKPVLSAEVVCIQNMPKRDNPDGANVIVRGVGEKARDLRPRLRVVAGRWFEAGKKECVVGVQMTRRFPSTGIGEKVHLGRSNYTVVGHFDIEKTGYESEFWGDAADIRNDYNRENYSTVLARLEEPSKTEEFSKALQDDKRLSHHARSELKYFAEAQSASGVITILGQFMAFVMGVGAAFSATNAMYAAVSARTREIATLKVLGFRPPAILASFLVESMILALVGGVIGAGISGGLLQVAIDLGYASTGTINFATFSEIVFDFRVAPENLASGLVFALAIGAGGGLLPAWSAARMSALAALKG